MKIESIKGFNITGQFLSSTDANYPNLSIEGVIKQYYENPDSPDTKKNVIEGPGFKLVILPEIKKEFIFEQARFLVTDRTAVFPSDSTIAEDIFKFKENNFFDPTQVIAYGFNFDAIATPDDSFNLSDLIGNKVSVFPGINKAGVTLSYVKNEFKYNLEVKDTGVENKYFIHLNSHISSPLPLDIETLKQQISSQFEEYKEVVSKI